jgi:hypothetical protein
MVVDWPEMNRFRLYYYDIFLYNFNAILISKTLLAFVIIRHSSSPSKVLYQARQHGLRQSRSQHSVRVGPKREISKVARTDVGHGQGSMYGI